MENDQKLLNGDFFSAVIRGDERVVLSLLKDGADVNFCTWSYDTPLHFAARKGKPSLCETLISFGANLDARNSQGKTPLHEVCKRGNLSVVQILLESGADVDSQDNEKHSSLHLAVHMEKPKIVSLLLENGANVFLANQLNNIPLHNACAQGKGKIAQMLLAKNVANQIKRQGSGGKRPLHFAVYSGKLEIVRAMLKHGADVDSLDESGSTPLNIACKNKNMKIAILLAENGANPNLAKSEQDSPLHAAVREQDSVAVNCLLLNDADVNVSFGNSKTPLDIAAEIGNVCLLHMLIAQMVKVKSLNLHVTKIEQNIDRICDRNVGLKTFADKCEKKIRSLKNEKLCKGHNLTLYDLLITPMNGLITFLRNEAIKRRVKVMDYQKRFGMYAVLLDTKVRCALGKAELIAKCHALIQEAVPKNFPMLCINKIMSYFSVNDMEMIVTSNDS